MTESALDLHPGDLIEHAKFGLGKVLEVQLRSVLVHFRDDDQDFRKLSIEKSPIQRAAPQADPRLESLPPFQDGKFAGRAGRVGLDAAIAEFQRSLPQGFADPAYAAQERDSKWAAHEAYERTLGNGAAEGLLAEGAVAELAKKVIACVGPTRLLSKFEAIALRDGLRNEAPATAFFHALLAFVQAPPDEPGFTRLADALENLPSETGKARVATWPVLTILPFLARPDRFMFLKPGPTVAGAHRLRFDLAYDSSLRWLTYHRLMTLSEFLLEKLRPIGARDYIDVQSFLWVIEKY